MSASEINASKRKSCLSWNDVQSRLIKELNLISQKERFSSKARGYGRAFKVNDSRGHLLVYKDHHTVIILFKVLLWNESSLMSFWQHCFITEVLQMKKTKKNKLVSFKIAHALDAWLIYYVTYVSWVKSQIQSHLFLIKCTVITTCWIHCVC